ncbi:PAAR domain-containing protein [Cupriavidus sp. WGlv3]|uniref:PAAR domain-containing protein n=1 Tax=Cupriavidus sp. WGlv3 TaxID=2919924 RepID=UPI00209029CA|nr:PAAR domain-containing protein [Cupriavidus sp. WGlv3]MCO4860913.1 PAAR domain-containing protein [Cupriavidus sp. WGlv3]
MMKGIICRGDKTDHGGTVIEGFANQSAHGRPWAGLGHLVVCPRCKGTFPIIEGHAQVTVDGTPVAMHGMRTACGAVLLASSALTVAEHPLPGAPLTAYMTHSAASATTLTSEAHNDLFVLRDRATGEPMPHVDYAIRRASGEIEYGRTNAHGQTHMLSTVVQAEGVEVYAEGLR